MANFLPPLATAFPVVQRRTSRRLITRIREDDRRGRSAAQEDGVVQGVDRECRGLVGDEAVAELGIVVVDVDRGVDQVRVVVVAVADRLAFHW